MRSRRDPTDRAREAERRAMQQYSDPHAWQIAADAWEEAGNLERAEWIRDVVDLPLKQLGLDHFIPQPVSWIDLVNDIDRAWGEIQDRLRAPLPVRQAARARFSRTMAENPEDIGEAIRDILRGDHIYSDTSRYRLINVLNSPRMNRIAAINNMVASDVWQVPTPFAIDAWKKLLPGHKKRLDVIIENEIRRAFIEYGTLPGGALPKRRRRQRP